MSVVAAPRVIRALGGAALRAVDIVSAALTGALLMLPALVSRECFLGSGTDILFQDHPLSAFAMGWMRRGVLPLWNPFIYSGVPSPSGIHGYFYPGWWTGLFLTTCTDLKVSYALHLALAGAGGAWFARVHVRSAAAAYLAGALFATSGFFSAHVFGGHRGLVATAAYVPWIVGTIDRARLRKASVSWAAVLFALAVLSAHYQLLVITALGATAFACTGALATCGDSLRVRFASAGRVLGWTVGLFALGLLIAAVQWVPFAMTLPHTQRGFMGEGFTTSYASRPAAFLTLLLPNLFGNAADVPLATGDYPFWEAFLYLGAGALVLATLALACLSWARWNRSPVCAAYAEHGISRVMWSSGLCGVVSSMTGNHVLEAGRDSA